MSGTMDVVIAGGVESMTRVPITLSAALPAQNGFGSYKSPNMEARYPGVEFSQFTGAEMIARKYDFSRDELDAYSSTATGRRSRRRRRRFDAEILPLEVALPDGSTALHAVDEGIRFDASLEAIARGEAAAPGGGASPPRARARSATARRPAWW